MSGGRPAGEATQFSLDPTEFAGKRALVTGGTKGMGEAIVRRLAAGGATVATTARSPASEGQAAKLFLQADISTREGVDLVIREVLDHLGGVDILVNNVGGSSAPSGGVLALGDAVGSTRSTPTCSLPSVWTVDCCPEC